MHNMLHTADVFQLKDLKIREFDGKNQSTRHKIPLGISETAQIEGFLGKRE